MYNSFAFYFVSQHCNHEAPGTGYTELLLPRHFKTFARSQLHTNLFLYDMKILSNKKLKTTFKVSCLYKRVDYRCKYNQLKGNEMTLLVTLTNENDNMKCLE